VTNTRQPALSRKAKAAIERYVRLRAKNQLYAHIIIDLTLKADRMKRADLYAWLRNKGYHWRYGQWIKKAD
jgi:hypothetical protein